MTFAFIFDSVCGTEWLVLLGVILIVVGPKNLPSAMRKFGKITAQLRRAADEFKRQIMAMDDEVRRTVDDAVKTDYVETPNDGNDGESTENYEPYPGQEEFYDETTYQNNGNDGTDGDVSAVQSESAALSDAEQQPVTENPADAPKVDPYEIKITVSTKADNKKGKGAKA